MGNLVQQMAETAVTMSMKKTDWPRRQLGQMKAEEEFAARKAVRQETQQHITQDGQEQRLAPPEAAQEAEGTSNACWPLQNLALSEEATALATVSTTEAALESVCWVKGDDGVPVLSRLQHQRQQPGVA